MQGSIMNRLPKLSGAIGKRCSAGVSVGVKRSHTLALEEAQPIKARALRPRIHSILIDRPRPGTPLTFTAQQVVRIVALVCEDPQEVGVPVTEWTPGELAQKAKERGIVETISPRTVERFLGMRLH